MKIYISSKISGIEKEAPELFEKAEQLLISKGYEVVNPMKLNHQHDQTWESYMKEDIKALCDCDGIYMFGDWKHSKGAREEYRISRTLKLKIIFEHELN